MSNNTNTNADNNITLYASSNIRGTIMRSHVDPHFVVKDVYITSEDGNLMIANDEVMGGYDHTIIQIPAPTVTSSSPGLSTAVWIMKLSGVDEALADAVSRRTFLAQNRVISRLDISLSIPAMNFDGVYDVCVVMCSPEHATRADRRYDVIAHGTIRFNHLFGQWTFTWENLTADTITETDTFNSASHP